MCHHLAHDGVLEAAVLILMARDTRFASHIIPVPSGWSGGLGFLLQGGGLRCFLSVLARHEADRGPQQEEERKRFEEFSCQFIVISSAILLIQVMSNTVCSAKPPYWHIILQAARFNRSDVHRLRECLVSC